jgi:hypothetical protein
LIFNLLEIRVLVVGVLRGHFVHLLQVPDDVEAVREALVALRTRKVVGFHVALVSQVAHQRVLNLVPAGEER